MKVLCVSPVAPLETPWGLVEAGQVIDVPDDVAGTPPTARRLAAEQALHDAHHAHPRSHEACAAAREALTDLAHEMGSGLLAQITEWQPVAKTKTSKDGEP